METARTLTDLITIFKDVVGELFGHLGVQDSFRLAWTCEPFYLWSLKDPRLNRVRNFLQSHVGREINYKPQYDETIRQLIDHGSFEELEFAYSARGALESDGTLEPDNIPTWLDEGFAQSWMSDKQTSAAWFSLKLVARVLSGHMFTLFGCSIPVRTIKHCLFVSRREKDKIEEVSTAIVS